MSEDEARFLEPCASEIRLLVARFGRKQVAARLGLKSRTVLELVKWTPVSTAVEDK